MKDYRDNIVSNLLNVGLHTIKLESQEIEGDETFATFYVGGDRYMVRTPNDEHDSNTKQCAINAWVRKQMAYLSDENPQLKRGAV